MGETGDSHVAGNKRVILESCNLTNTACAFPLAQAPADGVADSVFDHLVDAIDDAGDVAE